MLQIYNTGVSVMYSQKSYIYFQLRIRAVLYHIPCTWVCRCLPAFREILKAVPGERVETLMGVGSLCILHAASSISEPVTICSEERVHFVCDIYTYRCFVDLFFVHIWARLLYFLHYLCDPLKPFL